jgi:hypothetical protein
MLVRVPKVPAAPSFIEAANVAQRCYPRNSLLGQAGSCEARQGPK